jgi:phosphoserine phosphatase RsbU/P
VSSGREGLERYRDFDPDVVLCDYYLPDIDGLQVLRGVRNGGNRATRFIMVTAGLSGIDDERALRSEADAFLAKPIDLNELQAALSPKATSQPTGKFLDATYAKDLRNA